MFNHFKTYVFLCVCMFIGGSYFSTSYGTTLTWLTEKQLAQSSQLVATGTVLDIVMQDNHKYFLLQILKTFKADPQNKYPYIWIKDLSTKVKGGTRTVIGSPRFKKWQQVALFLVRNKAQLKGYSVYQVNGLTLGKYDLIFNKEISQYVVKRNLEDVAILPFNDREADEIKQTVLSEQSQKYTLTSLLKNSGLRPTLAARNKRP